MSGKRPAGVFWSVPAWTAQPAGQAVFSPRANVRFNPTDNINLRASYSFGFRAPQAFDEDLHIDNVGGTVSMIQLAKDLKEEKSQSLQPLCRYVFTAGATGRAICWQRVSIPIFRMYLP